MAPTLGFGWAHAFALADLLMALSLVLFAATIWPTLQAIRAQSSPSQAAAIAPATITISTTKNAKRFVTVQKI